jgi:hypothetical protein
VKPAGGWAAGEQGLHRGGRHRVPRARCSRVEQVDGQGRPRSPTRTRRPARGQTTRRLHTGRPAGIRSPDPAGLRDQSHIDANTVVLGGGYCGTIAAAQRIEVPLYQAVSMPASAIRFWPKLRSDCPSRTAAVNASLEPCGRRLARSACCVSSVPAQADSTTGSIIIVKPGHRAATGPERVFTLAKIFDCFDPC